MVVGDGKPYVAALVTIDPDVFAPWAEQHGKRGSLAAFTDDPDLLAEIQSGVDEANRAVSQAESIRRFTVLPVDWTEEQGQLTPSLKLRRNVVMRQFRREVESLYD
jgi:long-chain acyl-CoA synthetase